MLAVLVVAGPAAARQHRQVLVLYSTGRDAPMSVSGDRELPQQIERGLGQPVNFYSEYIDQGRFPDPDYQSAFTDFLRVKYQGQRIDLIIAVQAAALAFIDQRRREVFPETPVVFLDLAAPSSPQRRFANATGVLTELDLAGTVNLALALQPDTRYLFVVSGSGVPDRGYERQARAQLKPFESRLKVTYLSGLATKDLEARLEALPDQSIVYYLVVYQDGAGETFSPIEYAERVASVASAPVYWWSDSVMERGLVGGSLLDRQAMMAAIATLAVRVLKGEPAAGIPVSSPPLHVSQVDWRQLRRWRISEARVPPGTRVLFRQPTLWDGYRVYIIGAVALWLAQTALIVGLLVQSARRRQAEALVRGSQAELQTSYDRIRDLGGRLLNAQETERARIARELHDDVSQQVALLEIDLEQLSSAVPGDASGLADDALDRVHGIARSVHDLSHRLHPARLRLIGLVSAIQGLQRELSQSDIVISFTHDRVPSSLPPDLMLCVFRVVQEALQNAIKYSRARQVTVDLQGTADGLALTIADDGDGFDVQAAWGKGLGLISMGERLEAVGGRFDIRSTPASGTRLKASVPLRAAPARAV